MLLVVIIVVVVFSITLSDSLYGRHVFLFFNLLSLININFYYFIFLDVLREPAEPLSIARAVGNAAHEDLNGTFALTDLDSALASGANKAECSLELLLADGLWNVDLVAEDEHRNVLELIQEPCKLHLGLGEAGAVRGVDKVDDGVGVDAVLLPETTHLLVAAEVKGLELDAAHDKLLHRGLGGRLVDGKTVVLQHVKEGGLASVVEPKEQDLGVLVVKAQPRQYIKNPVEKEHLSLCLCFCFCFFFF